MSELIAQIEQRIGNALKDPIYIETALTHRSFINEQKELDQNQNNERLEFLGDAVLGMFVSHELMKRFPEEKEGVLSKYRSNLVNEKTLCQVAEEIHLEDFIKLGKGEDKNFGRKKPSILADTFEALVAAIYLSNGFEDTRSFLHSVLDSWFTKVSQNTLIDDFKSTLQELSLKEFKSTPRYILIHQHGPDHFKTFETQVIVNDKIMGKGKGKTKKDSEQMAAKVALTTIAFEGQS